MLTSSSSSSFLSNSCEMCCKCKCNLSSLFSPIRSHNSSYSSSLSQRISNNAPKESGMKLLLCSPPSATTTTTTAQQQKKTTTATTTTPTPLLSSTWARSVLKTFNLTRVSFLHQHFQNRTVKELWIQDELQHCHLTPLQIRFPSNGDVIVEFLNSHDAVAFVNHCADYSHSLKCELELGFEKDSSNVYVMNLPSLNFTEIQLRDLFACYGEVKSVKLVHLQPQPSSGCIGFVRFAQPSDAAAAIEQVNSGQIVLHNKLPVRCKLANRKEREREPMGSSGKGKKPTHTAAATTTSSSTPLLQPQGGSCNETLPPMPPTPVHYTLPSSAAPLYYTTAAPLAAVSYVPYYIPTMPGQPVGVYPWMACAPAAGPPPTVHYPFYNLI